MEIITKQQAEVYCELEELPKAIDDLIKLGFHITNIELQTNTISYDMQHIKIYRYYVYGEKVAKDSE